MVTEYTFWGELLMAKDSVQKTLPGGHVTEGHLINH